jgi:hypothetical protein
MRNVQLLCERLRLRSIIICLDELASRSETIEEQGHKRAITFFHGHFGELVRGQRPSKSNHVFFYGHFGELGLRGQRPSKSKTIEKQSRFCMDTSGSLNVIDFAVFLNLYEKRAAALRTSPTSQHYNLPR